MKHIFFAVCLLLVGGATLAQNSQEKIILSVETNPLAFFTGGYSGALYVNLPNRWAFGATLAGQPWSDFGQNIEDFLLESSDPDALTLRWPWAVGVGARYVFSRKNEGFYGQLMVGWEDFEVSVGDAKQTNGNGYIEPQIGYIWYPWGNKGFFLMPKLGGVFLVNRPERNLEGVTYQLSTFFPNPELRIGWRFGK
jgi:hypothetical protein